MIEKYAISAILLAAAQIATVSAADNGPDKAVEQVQKALALLEAGDENAAQQTAMPAANAGGEQGARAWLIIATARYRLGELESALEAYELCRKTSSSKAVRDYAFDKTLTIRKEIRNRLIPKSEEISKAAVERLAKVDRAFHFASAPNIIVQARNPELARMIADRAQVQLEKAWQNLGTEIKYPHQIRIFVHADRFEYASAAPPSPDWSNATARVDIVDGKSFPRIDLTQLDENGQFDARLLDRILPHELCHIAVMEYFGPDRCPLFLTEGLAMLAEKAGDPLRQILAGQSLLAEPAISVNDLISQELPLKKPELFYSLSYSLVEFLHSRLSPSQFKAFLAQIRTGCPFSHAIQRALGTSYKDDFVALLAETWKKYSIQQSTLLQAVQQALKIFRKTGKIRHIQTLKQITMSCGEFGKKLAGSSDVALIAVFLFFSAFLPYCSVTQAQVAARPASGPAAEDAWLSRIVLDELSRCNTAQEYTNLQKIASNAAVERLACGMPTNMDILIDLVYTIRVCRLLSAADVSGGTDLNKWLIANRDVTRLLLRAVEEYDSPSQALKNFGELVDAGRKDVLEYPALAVAFATSKPLENYRPQPNPASMLESFQYYVNPKNRFVYDLHKLSYEVLRYLADTRLSMDERKWALSNFAGNKNPADLYFAIPYDLDHYEKGKPRKNASQDYTLSNLLQFGGVCADQAYFASQVCKSLGIPAAMVKGAGTGGVGHVWLAVLGSAAGRPGLEWDSQTGRYKAYNFYTGTLRNPADGKEIFDSQLLLTGTASLMALQRIETADAEVFLARLANQRSDDNSIAALDTLKSLAKLHNDRFKDLPQITDKTLKYLAVKRKIDLALLEELLDLSIHQNTAQVPAWEFILELRKSDRLPAEHLDRFFMLLVANTSKQFPEFCCSKVLQIIPSIKDDGYRDNVYQKTIAMFGWRPDLQARILLDWGDSLRDRGKTDDALKAYRQAASQASKSVDVGLEAAARAEGIYRQANKLQQAIVMYQGLFAQSGKLDIGMEFRQQTAYYQFGKRLAGLFMENGNSSEAKRILNLIGE